MSVRALPAKGPVSSARVIDVIEVSLTRGDGTRQDPTRLVRQIWDMDGTLLADIDPHDTATSTVTTTFERATSVVDGSGIGSEFR